MLTEWHFDSYDNWIYVTGFGGVSFYHDGDPDKKTLLERFETNSGKTSILRYVEPRVLHLPNQDRAGPCGLASLPSQLNMKTIFTLATCLALTGCTSLAQNHAADLPTANLLSQPGPTFQVSDSDMHSPATFIAYGDMRFTDPSNTTSTDPRVRKWLVDKIAAEHPDAVLLNGDVPLNGNDTNDYAVYHAETGPWRDARLHVYPALGNHEFHGPNPQQCLENWWNAFPEMRNRRWYSAQLGTRLYTIAVDSDTSLLPGSDQGRWLSQQIQGLPASIDFVVISMHHPPSADIQKHIEVSHNPRPNEIALRDMLSKLAPATHARFLVSAGHIHNYERHNIDDVVYLVSGGGGARPYMVERTPDDLYQSKLFPNYNYVKFTLMNDRLDAVMYRIADPKAEKLTVEAKDHFELRAKSR